MLLGESVRSSGGPTDQYDIPTVVTGESLRDELLHTAAAESGSTLCENKQNQFSCEVWFKMIWNF